MLVCYLYKKAKMNFYPLLCQEHLAFYQSVHYILYSPQYHLRKENHIRYILANLCLQQYIVDMLPSAVLLDSVNYLPAL